MRFRSTLFAAFFLASSVTAAHDFEDRNPWKESDDWRIAAASSDLSVAFFIAKGLTRKVGETAETEVLIIYRDVGTRGDQQNLHLRINCTSLAQVLTAEQSFGPTGPLPPSIIREQAIPAAPEGSPHRIVAKTACGKVPFDSNIIAEPYRWAKARLQAPR